LGHHTRPQLHLCALSEHLCQGWLEGYLLTGRHGLFSCYEAFIHVIDSMFNQHAKWLKVTRELAWRKPISSLNYLLTSHVWRQDHNGFSHQDPGFVDLVANKKADIVRIYLPPDADTLLWVGDHCLRTYDRINVIVAGKQPEPQWLSMDEATKHCEAGVGIWHWASNEDDTILPDLVMACAGDVPTMETLAAVDLLRQAIPELKIRTVNVVDLLALQSRDQHPHGLTDEAFDAIFTADKPVIFSYHGYLYHPPPDLQTHQPSQHPRPRLHRGRHDDHTLRHDRPQRTRPFPPRHRSDRACAGHEGKSRRGARRLPWQACGTSRLCPRIW
jgi:xylulose-5-phosphate/fructose-6-phosphate phosphoketolase